MLSLGDDDDDIEIDLGEHMQLVMEDYINERREEHRPQMLDFMDDE